MGVMGVMDASFMYSRSNPVVMELLIIGRSRIAIGSVIVCFRIVMGRWSVGVKVRVYLRRELI